MAVRLNKRNGRFTVDYYPNGRKGGRKVFDLAAGTTREKAWEIHDNLLKARKKKKMALVQSGSSIGRLVPHYIKFCRSHQSPETADDKESQFKNYLTPFFGHMHIPDLTNPHITLYKQQTKDTAFIITNKKTGAKKPITNRTINKGMSYFSAFLKWAGEELNIAPALLLRFRRLPHVRPVPIVLTFDEASRFIQCAEKPYNVMFKTLFYLGLRLKAMRTARWENIDWSKKALRTIEKGNKTKWHPLPDDLFADIEALHAEKQSEWIFPSPRDPKKPINNVLKAVRRAKEAAGITKRVYPHLLRHSIGTHMVDSDVDIRTIQDMLGHSQISTTEWYTQVSLEKKRGAMNKAGIKTTR